MKTLTIQGGQTLSGTVRIGGAKNSAVALIPAAILASDPVTICNVPEITDIEALSNILKHLNVSVKRASESIVIDPSKMENKMITQELSSKLRASYYFMGALLGKYKKVTMYFPGGCKIGERPINLHLKGFEALGATVTIEDNVYTITADKLQGASIYLDTPSVGATINIMLAATLADGTTTIDNAAKEPEIANIATLLNQMGAKVSGAGTSMIKIVGVKELNGCFHEVIPDRIEAGTYLIFGALCGDHLKVDNIIPSHLEALTSKLEEMNIPLEIGIDYIYISKSPSQRSTNIKTLGYPGFPTDLQQPFTTLLTQSSGHSKVEETIWENRFMNVTYLNQMGANIKVNGMKATVDGKTPLHGEKVEATDLRAGASLVAAALIADGQTTITNVEHILRGYEEIVEKLTNVGAKIEINEID